MSKNVVKIVKDENENEQALFICPGCGSAHAPIIKSNVSSRAWGFNYNLIYWIGNNLIGKLIPICLQLQRNWKIRCNNCFLT